MLVEQGTVIHVVVTTTVIGHDRRVEVEGTVLQDNGSSIVVMLKTNETFPLRDGDRVRFYAKDSATRARNWHEADRCPNPSSVVDGMSPLPPGPPGARKVR